MSDIKEIPLADVKVGMRVRITHSWRGIARTAEARVSVARDDLISLSAGVGGVLHFSADDIDKIELITPPVPTFETGDRFRDRFDDCYTVGDPATHAVQYTGTEWASLGEIATLAEEVGPLTPIPERAQHGDGCSPWLWDPKTETTWVEASISDSGVTHRQIIGDGWVFGGYLVSNHDADTAIAARLIPWSERDHG